MREAKDVLTAEEEQELSRLLEPINEVRMPPSFLDEALAAAGFTPLLSGVIEQSMEEFSQEANTLTEEEEQELSRVLEPINEVRTPPYFLSHIMARLGSRLAMATTRIGILAVLPIGQAGFKPVIEIGDPMNMWKPVLGIRGLSRRTRIMILENTGTNDDLISPEIERLGDCDLERVLPPEITDEALWDATLEMQLNKQHQVELQLKVRNKVYLLQRFPEGI